MMTMNTSGPGLGALSVRPVPSLGAATLSDAQISAIAAQAAHDALSREALVALFKLYDKNTQDKLVAAMIAAGGNANDVKWSLGVARDQGFLGPYKQYAWAWGLLSTASAALSGYHGYKRNNSVGWAIGWFVLGSFFPVVTPVIAVAQGYGKRK